VVGDLGDLREVLLADDQDGRGVVGAGDLLAEERLVVVDVGPAQHVLEHRLLVELAAEVDGLGRLRRVDDDRLAVPVDLAGTVRPEERVEPAVVVAEAVAELEAERMAILLEQAAGGEQVVPGLGELVDAGFLEPVGAVHLELADVAPRQRLPLALRDDDLEDVLVPAAELLADAVGHVADVHQAVVEQEGLVEAGHGDLGSRLRLGDRRQAGEHAAHARRLVRHLDARHLLVLGQQGLREVVVEGLDERALADDGHRLGGGAGPAGSEGADHDATGDFQEIATRRHGSLRVQSMCCRARLPDSRPPTRGLSSRCALLARSIPYAHHQGVLSA